MQYVVLDMEWNQPWPGSPSARKELPSPIRGEIIQIGAVRVTDTQHVLDEFSVLVQPQYYRRLNRRVSSLTGIKEARLREEGVPFPEAIERFRKWCNGPATFLTWGFDDIVILRENLALHGLDARWAEKWYNAQMIFNAQTDGSSNQKALKTAMEAFGVRAVRQAHDALGDAFHTALVCAKLDLRKGIEQYQQALREHEDGLNGALLPGCIERKVYHGFADKRAALAAMAEKENRCPKCGAAMQLASKWYSQQGRRVSAKSVCPTHGEMILRVKLTTEEDGLRAARMVYEVSSAAGESFEALANQPRPKRRRHRSRRGRTPQSKEA